MSSELPYLGMPCGAGAGTVVRDYLVFQRGTVDGVDVCGSYTVPRANLAPRVITFFASSDGKLLV